MTLQELWDALEKFDWCYSFSDDGRVYNAGYAREAALKRAAQECGEQGLVLFAAFQEHMFTGPGWQVRERAPKPERPA